MYVCASYPLYGSGGLFCFSRGDKTGKNTGQGEAALCLASNLLWVKNSLKDGVVLIRYYIRGLISL
jgi:hypothetical protein